MQRREKICFDKQIATCTSPCLGRSFMIPEAGTVVEVVSITVIFQMCLEFAYAEEGGKF